MATRQHMASETVRAVQDDGHAAKLAELEAENRRLREEQAATRGVLKLVGGSASNLDEVLKALLDNAIRLCGAHAGGIFPVEGDSLRALNFYDPIDSQAALERTIRNQGPTRTIDRGSLPGRTAYERRPVRVDDAQADPDLDEVASANYTREGFRSGMGVPLMKDESLLGVFSVWRMELRPFSEGDIELLETFADQAAIALENARLVNELRVSLEQQTATSEILGVISRSPTDIQPVLEAIVAQAGRLCGAEDVGVYLVEGDGERARVRAGSGHFSHHVAIGRTVGFTPETLAGRAMASKKVQRDNDLSAASTPFKATRAFDLEMGMQGPLPGVCVPLLREGQSIGAICMSRRGQLPFTEPEINLVKTFADQAVIALENVRLFTELQQRTTDLQEALEQQTATSDVLQTISRSAFDLAAVLQTLVDSAVHLCGADGGTIYRAYGDTYQFECASMSGFGVDAGEVANFKSVFRGRLPDRGTVAGRAASERRMINIADAQTDPDFSQEFLAASKRHGTRGHLGVPMFRGDEVLGVFVMLRKQAEPFSPRQVELVKTFADQAVIAIENARLVSELRESLEQQTATADILGVISQSPTDVQPVLDSIVKQAERLCETDLVSVLLAEGDYLIQAAGGVDDGPILIRHSSVVGRVLLDRQFVQFEDMTKLSVDDYPTGAEFARRTGIRSMVEVPLVRNDVAVGVLTVHRREVRPFTDRQVELLRTFADQAVIAIENVRLFTELQQRTKDLQEALEQQTATSEVLQTISRSAFDLDAVLQTLVTNARSLCHADWSNIFMLEGEVFRSRATFGDIQGDYSLVSGRPLRAASRDSLTGRVSLERQTLQIEDIEADQELGADSLAMVAQAGIRSALGVPLLREGQVIGVFILGRKVVGPYGDQETKLVETFADQAVIAIENSRLLGKLQESLEQQTATADILSVISQSPTNIQPVLDAMLERATALCKATDGGIMLVEGDAFYLRAQKVNKRPRRLVPQMASRSPLRQGSPAGRAVRDRAVVHIPDVSLASNAEMDARAREVMRASQTILCVPLLHEEEAIGVILLHRVQVQPFSEREIELVKAFADQAVIAIENVRLFTELQQRTNDLQEALEQQTATSEVLQTISRSAFDLDAVLDALTESAVKLTGSSKGVITRFEGDHYRHTAGFGFSEAGVRSLEATPLRPLDNGSIAGRVGLTRDIVQVLDVLADRNVSEPIRGVSEMNEIRTALGVPLEREGMPIGVIVLFKTVVEAFTERQIELVKTFADQAVIAIENARLLRELQEALEQQTATAEILGVISHSPTDVQPVLDAIVEHAARLCETESVTVFLARDGELERVAEHALIGVPQRSRVPIRRDASMVARAFLDRNVIAVADMQALPEDEYPGVAERASRRGQRSNVWVPLVHQGAAAGVIVVGRAEVRPFTDRQVELLKTFADQAVIAIENVRLFTELQQRTQELGRSVERLQALGDVGQAVSSTLDLQQVLRTIIARAVQLARADNGTIYETDEAGRLVRRAVQGMTNREAQPFDDLGASSARELGRTLVGRAIDERRPIQTADAQAELAGLYSDRVAKVYETHGIRAVLAVPLLREGGVLGMIMLRRKTPGEFAPETVELLRTLASQSAIAIQNARLYAELERKSVELEVASQHKSQFLANMSHELRTPLNAIIGFSEMLSKHMLGELTPEQLDVVQDVLSSGRHLLALINDILDLSKVEAGRMELDVSSFSVPEVLDMALTMVRERAASHGIQLKLEVDPGIEDIEADERKIKQVLVNLLSNAVKFTSDGGSVAVRARRPEFRIQDSEFRDFVEISVTDSGIGIAPEDQAKVFEEFEQVGTAEAVKKEGTGLGLPLAKRFVELHGGQMWLQSQLGQGSTFAFTLPVRQAAGVSA